MFVFYFFPENNNRLYPWAYVMQGARKMLHYLVDNERLNLTPHISKNQGRDVYHKAIYDWLMEDLENISDFMSGIPLRFYNHQKNSKGKLIKCSVKRDKTVS